MRHTAIPRCLVFWALLAVLPSHAGRPLVTEDADVLEPHACEWESMAARSRETGARAVNAWTTQVGCGFGLQSQAALAVGHSGDDQVLQLGGKTALLPRQGNGTGLTLAWGAVALKQPGERLRHDLSYLNLVLTGGLADGLTGHANLGVTHSKLAHERSRNWNLALEWAAPIGVDLLGEWYGDNLNKPWAGVGLRWAASASWSLNASWARQTGPERVRLVTVGAKLGF